VPDLPKDTSFTRDHGITWDQYRLDRDFQVLPAPYDVAELLGLDPEQGTPVLQRRFVFYANERNTLNIAEGIPVLTVARQMFTGPEQDREPVGAANIIVPADNTSLDYTIDLE
jgi:DNA-binding GntR family transcriptional regulator